MSGNATGAETGCNGTCSHQEFFDLCMAKLKTQLAACQKRIMGDGDVR